MYFIMYILLNKLLYFVLKFFLFFYFYLNKVLENLVPLDEEGGDVALLLLVRMDKMSKFMIFLSNIYISSASAFFFFFHANVIKSMEEVEIHYQVT